jgi:hypothetical protein
MENEVRRTQTLTVEDTTGTHQNTIQDATRDRAAVLRLRARARDTPRVTWSSETVDNENLGRKKSNGTILIEATHSYLLSLLHIPSQG